MLNAIEFISNTPFARWHRERSVLTPDSVSNAAQQLGLTFACTSSVNVERYAVLQKGETLKEGTLASVSWFLDQFARGLVPAR